MTVRPPFTLPYAGIAPVFAGPPLHAGPGAAVLGRVTLGRNAWLGALSVIRADGHFVKAGDDLHLGARSTLHINHGIFPCILGDRVTVGEGACVHACTVGSDIAIDDGVVILDGAVVEDNVAFEAGSTVYPNKRIAGGCLYAGSPAKPVRPLAEGEVSRLRREIAARGRQPRTVPPGAIAAGSDIHASVFIAGTASVRGRLVAAAGASIWYSNDLDAGPAAIVIGPRTDIQDNTVIRCATAQGVTLGRDCAVGHNVTIHDCAVGEESLIGIGSTVAEGTNIGDRVLLAAAARTEPGQVLESGWMYTGSPARRFARVDEAKLAMTRLIVAQYCEYAQQFMALERDARRTAPALRAGA
jgi:carbonic anhydrase/acetyltransferase-like protein (isoleucine patch superfamily)